jgi:hypothetical protein
MPWGNNWADEVEDDLHDDLDDDLGIRDLDAAARGVA